MEHRTVYQPATDRPNDRKILLAFNQPLTAKQVAGKTGIPEDTCSYLMGKFAKNGLITCLNPAAQNSRLYWLTPHGQKYRNMMCAKANFPCKGDNFPTIDWELYGWICFTHRAAVIKTLTQPMQPSRIKQILRIQKPHIKISANNIRDVMKLLLARNIVRPVKVKKKAHWRYELTESGTKFRQLLLDAEQRLSWDSGTFIK